MTTRSSVNNEKKQSTIDKVDYEGLQLDTRARDDRDPHLDQSRPQGLLDDDFNHHDFYLSEKQAHAGNPVGVSTGTPISPGGTLSPISQMGPKEIDGGLRSPPPPERRICGLRPKHFWELLGLILAIILAVAIIGGVGTIFYVGLSGLLQEKRKIFSSTAYWEPGTLNDLNIATVANLSTPSVTPDSKNDWDGYRMAAVYSENFHNGPGLRLYYHTENLTGAAYVQELIWTQSNDSWADGAKLHNPWPTSHLAATIDESTQILRLFFSSGNNTLQEAWTSISDPTGTYKNGVSFPNLLDYNNADIATTSQNGSTYIYHYSSSSSAQPAIHELVLTGLPASPNNQETYNLSLPLVATPNLANDPQPSSRPLAASTTIVPGLAPLLYVFWADQVALDPPTGAAGFAELAVISRPLAQADWPDMSRGVGIPLGSSNSMPNQRKRRGWRSWMHEG
ncbi:MAG: hypothetical protein Q9161_001008 [Pseudevernia consocians]